MRPRKRTYILTRDFPLRRYVPRKCSATNRIIKAKDHGSVQISIAKVDENGRYTGENQVYADPSGTIAWQTGGLTPIRPNWDGTLPVPGDGRYEWAGFYDADQLPSAVDPEQGFLATANECNLPDDYPADRHVTYDWYAPYRRHRLDEVLATGAGKAAAIAEPTLALAYDRVGFLPAR